MALMLAIVPILFTTGCSEEEIGKEPCSPEIIPTKWISGTDTISDEYYPLLQVPADGGNYNLTCVDKCYPYHIFFVYVDNNKVWTSGVNSSNFFDVSAQDVEAHVVDKSITITVSPNTTGKERAITLSISLKNEDAEWLYDFDILQAAQ
jgi:hypothetical protein